MVRAANSPEAVRMLQSSPLRFEPAADSGTFTARGLRYQFTFSGAGAVLHAGDDTVRLKFEGASRLARVEGTGKLRSTSNVLRGNDPANWRTSIPNYGRLEVRNLYRGVNVVYYGNGRELEYDVVVKPGADPRNVRLRFEGGDPHIDAEGNLVAGFVQKRPAAFQLTANGTRVPVDSHYLRNADGTFRFALGRYDRTRELIIDPVLTFSYYFTGGLADVASAIGHDTAGFIYVAGTTASSDFPTTGNAASATLGGVSDIFFVKIDPNQPAASQVVVSTYLGGTNAETLNDMAVSPGGLVYLTGNTASTDFPTVNAAFSTIAGKSDAFVMCLDPAQSGSGMIIYSTLLGGSRDDEGNGIAVDAKGRIFVSGATRSTDFPNAGGILAANGSAETAFVAGFDPSRNTSATLIYATYLGGSGGEIGRGIAAAADGTVWVVGSTYSTDFPLAGYSYQAVYHPGGDGFVAQINPGIGGSGGLLYSTFLGGSGPDEAKNVIVDPAGRVIVSGYTGSSDFPVTATALQGVYGGNFDAFVTILNTVNPPPDRNAQLVYSTYYGGSQPDVAFDLKRDSAGNLYLTGMTMSPNLPVSSNALQPKYTDFTLDGFALEFNPARPSLGGLVYSSYVASRGQQIGYGIDFDTKGNMFVVGYTTGPLLDLLGGAQKVSSSGNTDGFLLGVNPSLVP